MSQGDFSILTGSGEGFLAKVNASGEILTNVANVVAATIAGTASVQSPANLVARTAATVTTASAQLVGTRSGRRGLWVQNQGANPVYLRFESQAATANDWLVPAVGEFRAEQFPYEGEIRAISTGGNSTVLVLEFYS